MRWLSGQTVCCANLNSQVQYLEPAYMWGERIDSTKLSLASTCPYHFYTFKGVTPAVHKAPCPVFSREGSPCPRSHGVCDCQGQRVEFASRIINWLQISGPPFPPDGLPVYGTLDTCYLPAVRSRCCIHATLS